MIAIPGRVHPRPDGQGFTPRRKPGDFVSDEMIETVHWYIMNDEPDIMNVYAKIACGQPFGTDSNFLRNESLALAHLK